MRRLYFRIYLAVLASLLVFAVAAGVLWRTVGSDGASWPGMALAAQLVQNMLPAVGAPRTEQQAALERIGANLHADISLFAADRSVLAAIGTALPEPSPASESRPAPAWRGGSPWVVSLRDGRVLAVRLQREARGAGGERGDSSEHGARGAPGLAVAGMLLLLFVVVGIAAHPVVRRITRRLERLQAGVNSLERGDLSARVAIKGRDEIAELATSFNRAAARIEALVNAHKMLLANASHELRTPLTRIRMGLELLKGNVDAKRRAELERDITELDELIDGILLSSRLDALTDKQARGEREKKEEVDLLALAAEECARYDECRLDGEPAVVLGDPQLLRRMIRNLLDNATRHGAAPIEVSVHRAHGKTQLKVTDHGPGIPEADRERVFEPFRRVSGGTAGPGAGLGLALVRQIARHHGGEATIEPSPHAGLRIIVSI